MTYQTKGVNMKFGLEGKKCIIVKGDYKGQEGIIIEETGYTEGYGVVCKIRLDNGKTVEYSHDFFEEL